MSFLPSHVVVDAISCSPIMFLTLFVFGLPSVVSALGRDLALLTLLGLEILTVGSLCSMTLTIDSGTGIWPKSLFERSSVHLPVKSACVLAAGTAARPSTTASENNATAMFFIMMAARVSRSHRGCRR